MSTDVSSHHERFTLTWWLWLVALAAAIGIGLEIHMGAPGVRAWLPYAILIPGTIGALWWLGRVQVSVHDGELRVDDARLPLSYVADAEALDAAGKRHVLTAGAHPHGFVIQRPWIKGAVRITLNDPNDPTPYWLISSRDPKALAAALRHRAPVSPDPALHA